jgi:hypothetical protein
MTRFSSRVFLGVLTATLALLAPATAQAYDYTPVRGTDFFKADGVWNKPLASNAPLSSNTKKLVSNLLNQVNTSGPWINTTQYSTPVYTVPADQPTVHVQLDAEANNPKLQADFDQVPIPSDARPAAGTDQHLVVWQPSTQTMWEFWLMRKDADGNWAARWGGKMSNVSSNPGYFPYPYGATATSLPLTGGLMTIQEEADGAFNHALAMALPKTKANSFVFPAQRTDGDDTSANAIPEGTRFRLPASLNIDAMNLPRQTKMMAKAVQKYGAIVRDKSGAVTFYGEDPHTFEQTNGLDPYPVYAFGGLSPSALLAQFPWRYMQVVRP